MKHELNVAGSAAVRPAGLTPTQEALTFRPLTLREFARLGTADDRATAHLTAKQISYYKAKRKARWPLPCVDERGVECYLVPLNDGRTKHTLVEAADYWNVRDGGADGLWMPIPASNGTGFLVQIKLPMRKNLPGHVALVARLILGLSGGQKVSYLNGDRSDLRRSNLAKTEGYSRCNTSSIARRGAERRDKLVAEGRTVGFPA